MEFMLSEALPIYSGGLGNVAGDQLKAASDLGVPVVGVGLLYQQGYFRQIIDKDGVQQALLTPRFSADRTVREYTSNTTSRLRLPTVNAPPTTAQWAERWSIGNIL
jgi:glycogen phosphorylase